jgi:glutamine synthetase
MPNNDYNFVLENPICKLVNKSKNELTRKDFLNIISKKQIERITFHYVAADGKLREMHIPVQNQYQTELILADGERVDGSSLFKGMITSEKSDLYVVPLYHSAFLNPFDSKSLDFFCRFFDDKGEPAAFTPDNILARAYSRLKEQTGFDLLALGELEFYLIFDQPTKQYLIGKQQGYHASPPFAKTTHIVNQMLTLLAQITGSIKYGHNEVGSIESLQSELEELNGKTAEQVEIEFNLSGIEDLANNIVLSSWVIRNVAYQNNCLATFFPKIDPGHAGNGLHFHLALSKNGRNKMVDSKNELSDYALKLIGGLCHFAPSLTAFGNTVSASYLRLVPGQEAPTRICWSKSDRNAMIRVPLAWSRTNNLASIINPSQKEILKYYEPRQTVEIRSPDGSAYVNLLLAGLSIAAEWGLTHPEEALKLARIYKISSEIQSSISQSMEVLGTSCVESAEKLLRHRYFFEKDGVFPPSVIDYYAKLLQSENDKDLNVRLISMPEEDRIIESRRIMHKNLYKC